MSFYSLHTQRNYTEKDNKLSFELRGINSKKELKKVVPGKWISIEFNEFFPQNVMGGSGVYAVNLKHKKTGKEDICYIGSSKSLPMRFCAHQTIAFLRYYLSSDFTIEIHLLYVDNFKTTEQTLINSIYPFLNRVNKQVRRFDIRKKTFNPPKHSYSTY